MATLKKFLLKLGLSGLTSTALVEKGRNHHTMLLDNPVYPTLQVELPGLEKACDDLDAANQAMMFNGGKIALQARRELEVALRGIITSLAQQVQVISEGVEANILSAGFDVRKAPEPITTIGQPQDLRARLTGFSGTVGLDWDSVYGARYYQVWITDGDPTKGEWTLAGVTTKSRHTVDHLTPGTFYSFRVNAVGARAESVYSDTATLMAA